MGGPYLRHRRFQELSWLCQMQFRVANIVSAMKEFTHPTRKEMAPVDINRVVERSVTVCRSEWKYLAELEFSLDEGLPRILHPTLSAHRPSDSKRDGSKGTMCALYEEQNAFKRRTSQRPLPQPLCAPCPRLRTNELYLPTPCAVFERPAKASDEF